MLSLKRNKIGRILGRGDGILRLGGLGCFLS